MEACGYSQPPQKGSRKILLNYRGASVTYYISRLYRQFFKGRLGNQYENMSIVRGQSCVDYSFALKRLLKKRMTKNVDAHLVLIDLKKA